MAGKKQPSAKQRAWRAEFARRYGGKKSKKKDSAKKGGKRQMARAKKNNGNGKRQGIVSWATSMIALGMALGSPIERAYTAWSKVSAGNRLKWFLSTTTADYTGYCPDLKLGFAPDGMTPGTFDAKRMIRGYAPLAGAYVFKKATSHVLKVAPIKSIIPRLGM